MNVEQMPEVVPIQDREWFLLFAICVAGKQAKATQAKLNEFLRDSCRLVPERVWKSPLAIVSHLDEIGHLESQLRKHKMGQYNRILGAFREVSRPEFSIEKHLTVKDLENVPGIGPKTARFVVLYTDKDANCVPLDTHILKYLAYHFPNVRVPKSTPPKGRKYLYLENLFRYKAKEAGKSVRQLDSEVWSYYANGGV
jgi:thermostable 8-oxoguanine DNA glycosylase